jgi:hypothetical protein
LINREYIKLNFDTFCCAVDCPLELVKKEVSIMHNIAPLPDDRGERFR